MILEVVRELVARGAAVDSGINDGSTPLYIASQYGRVAIARELLVRGADVNAHDDSGSTSLHAASFSGHAEVLRELLKRDGANVDARRTTMATRRSLTLVSAVT